MRRWNTAFALALVVLPLGAGIAATAQAQEPWQRDRWEERRREDWRERRDDERYAMESRDWAMQFERRLNHVAMRIDEATQRGEISPREARRLAWRRDALIAHEQRAISDRYLSPHEREDLDHQLFALARQLRIDVADAW